MSDKEFIYFADILSRMGSDALVRELTLVQTWSPTRLGQLAIYLAYLGGKKWPSTLAEMGADFNLKDDEGQSVISVCVFANCDGDHGPDNSVLDITSEFLSLGCDPNSSYLDSSVTALAVRRGARSITMLLLLAGADPDKDEPDPFSNRKLRDVFEESEETWPRQVLALRDTLLRGASP
jgi:hypothetical protein